MNGRLAKIIREVAEISDKRTLNLSRKVAATYCDCDYPCIFPYLLQDTAVKRASYVRCVASLLSQCSTDTKLKAKSFGPVLLFVLKDIESVAGSG